jgi:hypothetical protein
MRPRSRLLPVLLLLGIAAGGASAQQANWGNATVTAENDTLGLGGDENYTQGVRLTFTRVRGWDVATNLKRWLDEKGLLLGDEQYVELPSLVVGHYILTPRSITTFTPDPDDRPYAGLLYGGLRIDMYRKGDDDVDGSKSFEGIVGLMGPGAMAGAAQAGLHAIREHRDPKGWNQQIGTQLVVNSSYMSASRYVARPFDFTYNWGAALGTLQTFGTLGATVRVGKNLSGMPGSVAAFSVGSEARTAQRPSHEVGLFGAAHGRAFLWNTYYDGALIGGRPRVDKKPLVNELHAGFFYRYGDWRFAYTYVSRSREFDTALSNERHTFGSLTVSREYVKGRPGDEKLPRFLKPLFADLGVELGLGKGITRVLPESPGDRTLNGPAGRLGVTKGFDFAKGILRFFTVGGEITGVTREVGPPDARGAYTDRFLVTRAVTAGVRPFGLDQGRGVLHLRAGIGRTSVTTERGTGGLEPVREPAKKGRGFLVGANYQVKLGRVLSFGVDSTWSPGSIGASDLDRTKFLSAMLMVKATLPATAFP